MHFKTLGDVHRCNDYPLPEHPLLTLFTCNPLRNVSSYQVTTDFYIIALKPIHSGEIRYGRTRYDHQSGSMYFLKPQQTIQMSELTLASEGFEIWLHQDYLTGHPLHGQIGQYGYFNYELNEALHLSPKEEQIMWELYRKIETEYTNNQDEFTRTIILGHLESMLNYTQRFYKRQFLNRSLASGTTVTRFNTVLATYLTEDVLQQKGLPTVAILAEKLNLSARYLSDLLKQETGKTALELIHITLISAAKNLLLDDTYTVAETAYQLGFDNPPYFSRLFRKQTGLSPSQYRQKSIN